MHTKQTEIIMRSKEKEQQQEKAVEEEVEEIARIMGYKNCFVCRQKFSQKFLSCLGNIKTATNRALNCLQLCDAMHTEGTRAG